MFRRFLDFLIPKNDLGCVHSYYRSSNILKCRDVERIKCYYIGYYHKDIKELLYRAKKNGEFNILKDLGRDLGYLILSKNLRFDAVLCVPGDRKRMSQRGFNSSKLIAEEVGKVLNTNVLDIFNKIKSSRAQSNIKYIDRRKNVKDNFNLTNFTALKGVKSVLIIDDVITTSSTLSELSKALSTVYPHVVISFAVISST